MKKIALSFLLLISLSAFGSGHGEESHEEKSESSHEAKHEAKHEAEPEEAPLDEVSGNKVSAANDDQIVSQPAKCLAKKTVPCTFKSISRHAAIVGKTEFIFLKETVVRVTNFSTLTLEPVTGGFIVKTSKVPVTVKGIPLTKFPSYADITKDQIEVIDGKDFFVFRVTEGEPERYLLDREPFIKKLAIFYKDLASLRAEYKNISPIYNESFKQGLADHKKTLTRKIASIEEEKKEEALRQRRIREQQRKNKEAFYKRTFNQ